MDEGNIAEALAAQGSQEQSLEWFNRSLEHLSQAEQRMPEPSAESHSSLLTTISNRASTLENLSQFSEALADRDRAVELSSPSQQPKYRARRAFSRLKAGMVSEAVAEASELLESEEWTAQELHLFACIYSIASDLSGDRRVEYADRAMQTLQRAVVAGWKDASQLLQDSQLKALRERDDFKLLISELEKVLTSGGSAPDQNSKE
jgi:tetratricopeptide (TPR) repeat protein